MANNLDHRDAAFLPGDKRIVYAARKDPSRHPDRWEGTDLWEINADGTAEGSISEVCEIDTSFTVGSFAYTP